MAEALVRTIKRYYVRMQTLSCTSYQLGSITTTRVIRTRHSDIVHPVSSSQLMGFVTVSDRSGATTPKSDLFYHPRQRFSCFQDFTT
jgi:hypothetical protein